MNKAIGTMLINQMELYSLKQSIFHKYNKRIPSMFKPNIFIEFSFEKDERDNGHYLIKIKTMGLIKLFLEYRGLQRESIDYSQK